MSNTTLTADTGAGDTLTAVFDVGATTGPLDFVTGINAGESGGTDWIINAYLWSETGGGTISVVTGNGFTGNALRFDISAAGDVLRIATDANGDNVFAPGNSYEIQVKCRASIDDSGGMGIHAYGGTVSDPLIQSSEPTAVLSGAAQLANVDGTSLELKIANYSAGSWWYEIDEVTITDIT